MTILLAQNAAASLGSWAMNTVLEMPYSINFLIYAFENATFWVWTPYRLERDYQ